MRKNIVKGVLVAPLASGAFQGLLMQNWVAAVFALAFAYPFSLVIGLPLFLLLERNQKSSLPYLLISGLLGGVFAGFFFTGPGFQPFAVALSLLLFGAHGLLVAFAFWLVALRTNIHMFQTRQTSISS